MKLTVGLSSIDDFLSYVQAGAEEVFIGYIPASFLAQFQNYPNLNRREVLYANVQIGSYSDLVILHKMSEKTKVPVTITLNSLFYHPNQFDLIRQVVLDCLKAGFDTFIVADLALLVYLQEQGLLDLIKVHLSGEFGEINEYTLYFLSQFHLKRIIFHRKVSLNNMEKLIDHQMEVEAFLLNEKCHFHGGYCQSIHSDFLRPGCLIPYKMEMDVPQIELSNSLIGESGCGLCALYRMKQMGITHLKIVGRGNFAEKTIEDIRACKRALQLVEEAGSEEEYITRLKEELFKEGCSENCYYLM